VVEAIREYADTDEQEFNYTWGNDTEQGLLTDLEHARAILADRRCDVASIVVTSPTDRRTGSPLNEIDSARPRWWACIEFKSGPR
jgi:hypothetical protein